MVQLHSAGGASARRIALSLLCLFCLAPDGFADPRVFTDKKGREIIAEIVSARGDSVTLKKDGKSFNTAIDLFSADDQKFIRQWMKDNPPKIDYHFDIDVDKAKLSGDTKGSGYYRRKQGKYAYRVTVTNRTRGEVQGLTAKYRAFMLDRVTGESYYYPTSKPETVKKEGSVKLPALKLNLSAQFNTETFEMQEAQHYDTTRVAKDELIGILLRIFDAQGEIVEDFREGTSAFKHITWDGEKDGEAVVVKPLGS